MRVKSVHVFLAAAAIYGLVHVMLLLLSGWLGGRFSTLTPLFSTFLSLSGSSSCCVESVCIYFQNRGEAVLRAPSTVIEQLDRRWPSRALKSRSNALPGPVGSLRRTILSICFCGFGAAAAAFVVRGFDVG